MFSKHSNYYYYSAIVLPGQGSEWCHATEALSRGVFKTETDAQAWLTEKGLAGYAKFYNLD